MQIESIEIQRAANPLDVLGWVACSECFKREVPAAASSSPKVSKGWPGTLSTRAPATIELDK
jgi:hypothetical protein